MNDQSLGSFVDGELLRSVDENLAPGGREREKAERKPKHDQLSPSSLPNSTTRAKKGSSLLALVLVSSFQTINLDELVERSLDAAALSNLNGEIEERVEGIRGMTTLGTGDSRTKTTSEKLMDRGGVLEIAVDVPAEEEEEDARGRGKVSSRFRRTERGGGRESSFGKRGGWMEKESGGGY